MLASRPAMNVALALFRYFPHGGMQRDLAATARLLRDRGHEVTVFCHTLDGSPPTDVEVEVLPAPGRSNHSRARAFARALEHRLSVRRPDVVVGFDKMPGLDLYFAADPCFVTRTADRPWPYRLTPRSRCFTALESSVFGDGGADVLLLDERERDNYQRVYGTADARFTLLPPGVARDRRMDADAASRRARARAALRLEDDVFVLLHLAANFHLKGLDRALHALRALPEALRAQTHILAVGEGPTDKWSRAIDRLGLSGRCTLAAARDDVPDLLQAAELLIHPARHDTTGTVLMEAVVAGLPVLCTDACGYATRINDAGAGVVIREPFTQAALDSALASMRAAALDPYRRAALRYADAVDLHSMHDRVVAQIERAATRR
ncbi:MAG: hypothetical protein CMJ88_00635 [Planctomycetes bacterium]|nr:hypothetical protein [Planctomycetota bacterium]